MLESLSRDWWTLVFRGAVAVILGIVAFAYPGVTVAALTLLFGIYALIDGVLALFAAVRLAKQHRRWWFAVVEAIAGIAAAFIAFTFTILTAVVLVYLIAAWAIVTGILEIVIAVELRKHIEHEWMMGVGGVVSILLGVFLFGFPGAGLVVWAWMFGAYAIVFGISLIALGLRLHRRTGQSGFIAQH